MIEVSEENLFSVRNSLKIALNIFKDPVDGIIRVHMLEKQLGEYTVFAFISILSKVVASSSVNDQYIGSADVAVLHLEVCISFSLSTVNQLCAAGVEDNYKGRFARKTTVRYLLKDVIKRDENFL